MLLIIPVAITVAERIGHWNTKRRLSVASTRTEIVVQCDGSGEERKC
jgi:hypothetical protein